MAAQAPSLSTNADYQNMIEEHKKLKEYADTKEKLITKYTQEFLDSTSHMDEIYPPNCPLHDSEFFKTCAKLIPVIEDHIAELQKIICLGNQLYQKLNEQIEQNQAEDTNQVHNDIEKIWERINLKQQQIKERRDQAPINDDILSLSLKMSRAITLQKNVSEMAQELLPKISELEEQNNEDMVTKLIDCLQTIGIIEYYVTKKFPEIKNSADEIYSELRNQIEHNNTEIEIHSDTINQTRSTIEETSVAITNQFNNAVTKMQSLPEDVRFQAFVIERCLKQLLKEQFPDKSEEEIFEMLKNPMIIHTE